MSAHTASSRQHGAGGLRSTVLLLAAAAVLPLQALPDTAGGASSDTYFPPEDFNYHGPALKQAVEVAPPDAIQRVSTSELEQQAHQLIQANKFVEAIPYLAELVRRLDDDTSVSQAQTMENMLFFLGVGYLQNEDFQSAVDTFRRYLERFPKGRRARIALELQADALRLNESFDEAAAAYGRLRADYPLSEAEDLDVLARQAECHVVQGAWENAFPLLETLFTRARAPQLKGKAATALAMAYVGLDREAEVSRVLPVLMSTPYARYDVNFNLALIQGGDKLYARGAMSEALLLYRLALDKPKLMAWLDGRIGSAEQDHTRALAELDFKAALSARGRVRELKTQRSDLAKTTDYSANLRFRIAQTYYELGQPWEAMWTYWTAWRDYPSTDFAEDALFAACSIASELHQYDRAIELGLAYVGQFRDGNYYDDVTLMLTQIYLAKGEYTRCIDMARSTMARAPEHSYADQLHFLIGYAYFELEKFREALATFRSLRDSFSETSAREPCDYWIAMTLLYMEDYEQAMEEFSEFIARYSGGLYHEDAQFRVGVCLYGLGRFEDARVSLRNFIRAYPASRLRAECHMFLGDIAGALGRLSDALREYKTVERYTDNMQRINYAATQIGTILEFRGDYQAMADYFLEYLRKYRQRGYYAEAIWRIGFAREQMGDWEGMHRLYERAMVTMGNTPSAIGIDHIMETYPESYLRHHGKEPYPVMVAMLEQAEARGERTLALRLRRSISKLEAARDKPRPVFIESDLSYASPAVLVWIAERAANNPALARKALDRVLTHYKETEWCEDAMFQLAEMEFAATNLSVAISLYGQVIEAFPDSHRSGFAMKRKADALFAAGNTMDARDAYLSVLEVREWRGPLWPECLYGVGTTYMQEGQLREAFAYFQRVYVLYQAYPQWVARAYVKSAECLERLNRRAEAMLTYRELMGVTAARSTPEYALAAERLKQLE
jgi:TolA-binding protein